MTDPLRRRLDALAAYRDAGRLLSSRIGLEKESLRVTPQGHVAQTSHPTALGAALTHSWITTDFSEALLELVTPPFDDARHTLSYLRDLHRFVYERLPADEVLWVASMPCFLDGDSAIPLAEYGTSNSGRMKTIYRQGLTHRYGKAMQTIAGVHFNFSPVDELWPVLHEHAESPLSLRAFRDEMFFSLLRNYRRNGWLILYLFGASPALCKSFFGGKPTLLPELSPGTHYGPWATTLRMSDIGYRSSRQAGLSPSMNSLTEYVRDLEHGVSTRDPVYAQIGVREGDTWHQLSDSILQIENEFYGFIRPKQPVTSGERPIHALTERGVAYVEIRALDVNPFEDVGVGSTAMRFLESLLWWCLLSESPLMDADALRCCDANHSRIAAEGRRPDVMIHQNDGKRPFRELAAELLDAMEPVCTLLDDHREGRPHLDALEQQREKVRDVEQTPSARFIADLRTSDVPYYRYVLERSERARERFLAGAPIESSRLEAFEREVERSLAAQRTIEASDSLSFEDFLARYYHGA